MILTNTGWCFGTCFMNFHILGISSSQLTNSIIFQRGRHTTNQNIFGMIWCIFLYRCMIGVCSIVWQTWCEASSPGIWVWTWMMLPCSRSPQMVSRFQGLGPKELENAQDAEVLALGCPKGCWYLLYSSFFFLSCSPLSGMTPIEFRFWVVLGLSPSSTNHMKH